jgi:MmeI, DNA-methyltransferase domain
MPSLAPALRKKLEDAVKEARDVAELGARAALEELAVHETEPLGDSSSEDRALRNRLRARARQLGDVRNAQTAAHQIDHLVVECAYEHWHRMLFARFLAENGVLIANSGSLGIENTPVTLGECEELAADEGAANGWELAGRYASRMLPQIFRPDAPVLSVHLPPERQRRLEQILADLAPETFKSSDALGWVYQFWQAKKKDEVNASGVKIGADELPAVTQLFTEPYMVEFLLHNTLGAWWAGKVLAERGELARTATSEEELRTACSLPGCSWRFLRFTKIADHWLPAAGTFGAWPSAAAELRVLDPCCGSGHFLVAAFDVLVRLRMAQEGLTAPRAGDAVLRDNLCGLEIDERCTQLAAFALALAAWTTQGGEGHRELPNMSVACSGLAPRAKRAEWLALAGSHARLRNGMDHLYELFSEAPTLGSLIDPTSVGYAGRQQELGIAQFDELRPLLEAAFLSERSESVHADRELQVTARGVAAAAAILGARFHLTLTNVPYLSRGKQAQSLMDFCARHYCRSRTDLATVFMERCLQLVAPSGTCAAVAPQNWRFQPTYEALRRSSLVERRIDFVNVLGKGAFETISGEVVNVGLFVVSASAPQSEHEIRCVDASAPRTPEGKASLSQSGDVHSTLQCSQLKNPGAAITLEAPSGLPLLEASASSFQGIKTGDDGRFRRCFWELAEIDDEWRRYQSTVSNRCLFGGLEFVIRWENDGAGLARRQGVAAWGRRGIAISQMSGLPASIYLGGVFDSNMSAIVPHDAKDLAAVFAFCSSDAYVESVRQVDHALKPTNSSLVRVPFDAERWHASAEQLSLDIEPSSPDSTQWAFDREIADATVPLQVAIARLLGYRWPNQPADALEEHGDDDGIVCLPSVRGEEPAAVRLLSLLGAAYGRRWSTTERDDLLSSVGCREKGVAWWLQNKFFEQHCQHFRHRPFIWHIWDGIKKDGFSALVNYHKLDRKLLETLTYTYLGDWLRRQQDDTARNVDGASERLDAARQLQKNLGLILEGEKPYDLFVRWKPLHRQPIGWEPDLKDGVRVNIRPFLLVPDVAKKGAGVLRYKPNIHWKKDRGTDPTDAPWFELGPTYGEPRGARINDHHLTLAEKREARERAGGR